MQACKRANKHASKQASQLASKRANNPPNKQSRGLHLEHPPPPNKTLGRLFLRSAYFLPFSNNRTTTGCGVSPPRPLANRGQGQETYAQANQNTCVAFLPLSSPTHLVCNKYDHRHQIGPTRRYGLAPVHGVTHPRARAADRKRLILLLLRRHQFRYEKNSVIVLKTLSHSVSMIAEYE